MTAYTYNLKGGGSECSYLSINSTGAACFVSSVTANGDIIYNNVGNQNLIITSGAANNGRMYIYSAGNADIGFQASGSSWFSNKLGIGTNSPGGILQVSSENSGNTQMLLVRNYATSATGNFTGCYTAEIRGTSNGCVRHAMLINNEENDSTRRVLDITSTFGTIASFVSNGNVGIGTSTPTRTLEIRTGGSNTTPSSIFNGAVVQAIVAGEPQLVFSSNISPTLGIPTATELARAGMGFQYLSAANPSEFSIGIQCTNVCNSNLKIWNNAVRLTIGSTGTSTFACDLCSKTLTTFGGGLNENFSSSGGGHVTRYFAVKYMSENATHAFFKITTSGASATYIKLVGTNAGVGWYSSQVYHAANSAYWGGWIGSGAQISLIGTSAGYITGTHSDGAGGQTFCVLVGNNGTGTSSLIFAYITTVTYAGYSTSFTQL
jgi:hypothetical protein